MDRTVDRLGRSGRLAGMLEGLPGAKQRLRRYASEVVALAAEALAFDDRDAQPAVGQPAGAVSAGGPAAEDDDVVVRDSAPGYLALAARGLRGGRFFALGTSRAAPMAPPRSPSATGSTAGGRSSTNRCGIIADSIRFT